MASWRRSTSSCAITPARSMASPRSRIRSTVAPGYELAVAAALDGRLAAAVVDKIDDGDALLDRAGNEGGRALDLWIRRLDRRTRDTAGRRRRAAARACPRRRGDARGRGAAAGRYLGPRQPRRLPDRVRGRGRDPRRSCLERPCPGASPGAGRRRRPRACPTKPPRDSWSPNQSAPSRPSSTPAGAIDRAAEAAAAADAERDRLVAAHRAAIRTHDEAVEERRRVAAQIDRRRAAPDEGPGADRRAQLTAQLTAERAMLDRLAAERADRKRRLRSAGRLGGP